MASQKSKFAVGIFLTSGIVIGVLIFIWLGMSRYLERGQFYVTYFNESVQGLDLGSPVKYRGVTIGRVESLQVAPDAKLIEVVMKIESDQTLGADVVAQLAAIGITGTMFVELDRKREDEPDVSPPLEFPAKYPVIPSKPSNISKLMEGIDDMLKRINALDLKAISKKTENTLDAISQAVADANLKGISSSAQRFLHNLEHALAKDRWDRILSSLEEAAQSLNIVMSKADRSLDITESSLAKVDDILSENQELIKATIHDLRLAAENAKRLMEEGAVLVEDSGEAFSRLERHLLDIARNLERASANVERMTERAADNPSQVLFGEPPAPREVQSKTRP